MPDVGEGRKLRMWEEEMLGEYLARFHATARTMHRVRLGPHGSTITDEALSASERKLLGAAFRRWADAVVLDRGELLVVETKLIPDPRDISQLEVYLKLVPTTPELAEWHGWPRRGVLVWAVDDPFSRQHAVERGLEVRIFKPAHFEEWLSVQRARESRPRRTNLPVASGAG